MIIRIEKKLEEWWACQEEYVEMSDEGILELIQEDISAFLENAKWECIREDGEAEEICDMLNIAYALGRASNGESN